MEMRMAMATREDYNVFSELYNKLQYAGMESSEGSPEFSRTGSAIKSYEDYAELAGKEWIYFGVDEGEVIGYVIITPYEDLSVKLQEIYINKSNQRRGSGQMLVTLLKEFLKKEGFEKIFLFSASMETDQFWFRCRFHSVDNSEKFEYIIQ